MRYLRAAAVLLLIALCTSCYQGSSAKPVSEDEVPDMVLYDAEYTLGDNNSSSVNLKAKTITVYSDKTLFDDVSVNQKNLTGSCVKAVVTDSSSIMLSDGIEINITSDNAKILCSELKWDNRENTIVADNNMSISYDDGSEIDAGYFESDLDEGLYSFRRIKKAQFVAEGKNTYVVTCDSFDYNSNTEVLATDGYFSVLEKDTDTALSGYKLDFDRQNSKLTIDRNACFTKNQDDGNVSCSAATLVYDSDNSFLTLSGGIDFEKELDNGKLSCSTGTATYSTDNGILTIDEDTTFTKQEDNATIDCTAKSLVYNSEEGIVKISKDVNFTRKNEDSTVNCSSGYIEYDINKHVITISESVVFTKDTDDGLLKCTSESMVYNTESNELTIKGGAKVTWGNNNYSASEIFINLDTEKIVLKGPVTGEIHG